MFVIEILERIGKDPIRLEASQAVIRMSDGTPVSFAAIYGTDRSVMVSHCDDANFNDNLKKLGITDTVIAEKLKV